MWHKEGSSTRVYVKGQGKGVQLGVVKSRLWTALLCCSSFTTDPTSLDVWYSTGLTSVHVHADGCHHAGYLAAYVL